MKAQNYCLGVVLGSIEIMCVRENDKTQKTESQLNRHKCQNNLKPFSMSLSELYSNNRLSEELWNVYVCGSGLGCVCTLLCNIYLMGMCVSMWIAHRTSIVHNIGSKTKTIPRKECGSLLCLRLCMLIWMFYCKISRCHCVVAPDPADFAVYYYYCAEFRKAKYIYILR